MVVETAALGFVAGLAATGAMVLVELPAYRRWGLRAVMEWEENQALASRLTGRPRDRLVVPGLAFHFLHGALAGVVFILGVPLLPWAAPVLVLGALFGVALWLVTLVIHGPITGTPPRVDRIGRIALSVSLAGHVAYGLALGLLVGVA